MGKLHILVGKLNSLFLWPCSIAMACYGYVSLPEGIFNVTYVHWYNVVHILSLYKSLDALLVPAALKTYAEKQHRVVWQIAGVLPYHLQVPRSYFQPLWRGCFLGKFWIYPILIIWLYDGMMQMHHCF